MRMYFITFLQKGKKIAARFQERYRRWGVWRRYESGKSTLEYQLGTLPISLRNGDTTVGGPLN